MAQRSMQVENRVRNGEAVVASGRTHRDIIAPAAADRLDVLSAKEIAKIIDALCSSLELVTGALGAAEDRCVAEQADDIEPRQKRDRAVVKLLTLQIRVRSRIENALGDEGLARYGLDGPSPRTPNALASRLENTVNLLRSDPTELDDGLGEVLPTAKLADTLEAALAPLTEALGTLVVEERENEAALTDRDRAIIEWTLVYQSVATILSGLYRLAGRDDLAERIRPTERRASGLESAPADEAPTGAAPTGAGPTEGGPTEA